MQLLLWSCCWNQQPAFPMNDCWSNCERLIRAIWASFSANDASKKLAFSRQTLLSNSSASFQTPKSLWLSLNSASCPIIALLCSIRKASALCFAKAIAWLFSPSCKIRLFLDWHSWSLSFFLRCVVFVALEFEKDSITTNLGHQIFHIWFWCKKLGF